MVSLTEENERLRRERTALKIRVQWLEALLSPRHEFPPEWGLTPGEARVLAVLVAAGRLTPLGVIDLSGDLVGPQAESRSLASVRVHAIRRKVGAVIHVAYGQGYYLAEDDRRRLRRYVVTDLEKCEVPAAALRGGTGGWDVPPAKVADWRLFRRKGYSADEAAELLGLARRGGSALEGPDATPATHS